MNALPVDSVFEAAVDPSGLLTVTVLLVIVDADSRALTRVPAVPSKASSWSSPAPEVTVQLFGTLAKGSQGGGPHPVLAATVGAAADAVDVVFDRHVTAALNGDQITRDPATPLAAGDTVFFLSADAGG